MPRLSDDFLTELMSKADIEQVISAYVPLKRSGTNRLVGLCPFHNEKTPSFSVSTDKQLYHCFGCGASGTVITFIKEIENLDFYDAVKFLCDKYGVAMPQENSVDSAISAKKRKIKEVNRAAAKFYYKVLMSEQGKVCLDYLLSRGITLQTIQHFGLGYAPDEWHCLLDYMRKNGYTNQDVVDAGLARRSTKGEKTNCYDMFRGRMVIPLIDTSGNVLAFSGRVLDDSKPKYINTSDTLVYKKSEQLFALNFAKNKNNGKLILAEGGMDAIALHQAGFTNTVASFGTALTAEQTRVIARYADEVCIVYDSDEAGRKAVQRAINLFSSTDIKIKVPTLTGGKDPDEIIRKYGAEKFKGMLDGAANDIEYKILDVRSKYDLDTPDGKVSFLKDIAKLLAQVRSPIERDVYAGKISDELKTSKQALLAQIDQIRRKNFNRAKAERFNLVKNNVRGYNDKVNRERGTSVKAAGAEEEIIATLIKNPDYLSKGEPIKAEDFVTEFNAGLFNAVKSRIERGEKLEIMYMSQELSKEEFERLVEIDSRIGSFENDVTYYNECVETVKSEKERLNSVSPDKMSDEQFLEAFGKMKK